MKRTLAIALLTIVAGAIFVATYPRGTRPDPIPKFRQQPDLSGEWVQQSRIVNGARVDDPTDAYLVVTDDGRMEHHVPSGGTAESGSTIVNNQYFRLTPNGEFVDIDRSGRPDWTDVTRGLCRLDGDTLTLCLAPKGRPRPTVLATGDLEGAGSVLMVFKRR